MRFVVRMHHFSLEHSLYPLVMSTLLAVALFAGRAYFTRRSTYAFMLWNLFLAWIPYLCALLVVLLARRRAWWRWLMLAPAALWLLFLPNAPYLVTDLLHLTERPPVPLWYDTGFFATFVWTGLFLGVASLSAMQSVVKQMLGWLASWLFVFGVAALSGLGIYLGRFLNWNSWDLFFNAEYILLDLAHRVMHPIHNLQMYGVSLLFAAFLLVCYLSFISMRHHAPQRAGSQR